MRSQPALGLVLLGVLVAACQPQAPAPGPISTTAPTAGTPAPVPAQSTPPVNTAAPAADAPTGSLRLGLPAEGSISFAGFGPAKFGDGAEAVRQAWGGDLGHEKPSEPGGCYYLTPTPASAQGYRLGFMIEGDKFVRIDAKAERISAPGGGKVGMDEAALRKLYPGLQTLPHKYVEGAHYLAVAAGGGAPSKLVFETDATGKVTRWRIGLLPQVDYVEGCA